jgi:O-antigen biosynthesis protein
MTEYKAPPLTSYAQNFEDVMLWRALKGVRNGFYVDVGAHSPNVDSVSRLFYENGWRGVHIEPVAKWAQELRQARPDEKVIEAILGAESGTGTIYVLGDSGLNTTHLDIAESHQRDVGLFFESALVKKLTLNDVFHQSDSAEIHWLKVDVEGDEAAVVDGWDRDKFRPWVVVIEATNPASVKTYDTRWESDLTSSRYELVYEDGLNKFFIASERVDELRDFYKYPPNVFDNFAVSTGAGPWGREAANAVVRLREQIQNSNDLEARLEANYKVAEELSAAMRSLIAHASLDQPPIQPETGKKTELSNLSNFRRVKHQTDQLRQKDLNDEAKAAGKLMIESAEDHKDVHSYLLEQMKELTRMSQARAADRIALAQEEISLAKIGLEEQKKLSHIIADTINQLCTEQRTLIRLLAEQTEKRSSFEQRYTEMQRIHVMENAMHLEKVSELEATLSGQALENSELKARLGKIESSNRDLLNAHETLRANHHKLVYKSNDIQESYDDLVNAEASVRADLRSCLETIASTNALATTINQNNKVLQQSYHDLAIRFNSLLARKSWQATKPLRKALAALTGRQFIEPSLADLSVVHSVPVPSIGVGEVVLGTLSNIAPKVTTNSELAQTPSEYELAIARAPVHRDWLTFRDAAPLVSIVILQYMKSDLTVNCVRSILKYTDPLKVEIVVVDNGSSSEHVEALVTQFNDIVKIVRVGVNRYFGEGNNIGVEVSRGKLVVIMNNDIVVTKGWLEPLIYQISIEETGAVGPCFLYPDGRLQECGGYISSDGVVEQRGKGASVDTVGLGAFDCDYISAALLLIRRDDYLRIGGFDLCYEPAYYEDVDLCFKLIAHGLRITCVPIVKVFHNENATSADPVLGLNLNNIVSINATKFYGRWGAWLKAERKVAAPNLIPNFPLRTTQFPGQWKINAQSKQALIYTPYALTPGGGEKYILTIAEHLLSSHAVTLVTHHTYSEIRIKQLAHALNLKLEGLALACFTPEALERDWDIAFVLGNSIAPPFSIKARKRFYICQFPFDFRAFIGQPIARSDEYDYVCYSEFVRKNVLAVATSPAPRVCVVPPQVDSFNRAGKKRNVILSVGRFFEGGHCKNQHLLIEAFERLVKKIEYCDWRLALAGSTRPEPEHRDYYQMCKSLAKNLNVDFYPDISHEALSNLYAQSSVYWHGAGIDVDEEDFPERCEHFGISPLEAVSAGCCVYIWRVGGPAENAAAGVPNMIEFSSIDDLLNKMSHRVDLTKNQCDQASDLIERNFGSAAFSKRLTALVGSDCIEGAFESTSA